MEERKFKICDIEVEIITFVVRYQIRSDKIYLRHGPFDILGGGGGLGYFGQKFLALILTKKINLLNGTVKKIICLQ